MASGIIKNFQPVQLGSTLRRFSSNLLVKSSFAKRKSLGPRDTAQPSQGFPSQLHISELFGSENGSINGSPWLYINGDVVSQSRVNV